jgi:hypothetical protein
MLGLVIMWLVLALLTLWAVAALYVDFRIAALRIPLTVIYVLAIIAVLVKVKRWLWAAALCFAGFCVVLTWWLSLKPSNDGDWQADTSRTAWAEINGDRVTIHNLRNCDYHTEIEYSDCWSDRTVYLSQLRFADLFFTTWGPKYIGHPIVSFQFGDNDHVAFSIEARYKAGQSYSATLGFFRQYELIFITADERDVIRLRTNYRKDEQVFLYRTTVSPERALVPGDFVHDLAHLSGIVSGGIDPANQAAHAGAGDMVKRNMVFLQPGNDTHVGKSQRPTALEHQAYGRTL